MIRLETTLAVQQAATIDAIPTGFSEAAFTVLVFDNIGFAEETISGSGTTHHINRIMIQIKRERLALEAPTEAGQAVRSGSRTFKPKHSEIDPYYITKSKVHALRLKTFQLLVMVRRFLKHQ